jgi:hypothetical protein
MYQINPNYQVLGLLRFSIQFPITISAELCSVKCPFGQVKTGEMPGLDQTTTILGSQIETPILSLLKPNHPYVWAKPNLLYL